MATKRNHLFRYQYSLWPLSAFWYKCPPFCCFNSPRICKPGIKKDFSWFSRINIRNMSLLLKLLYLLQTISIHVPSFFWKRIQHSFGSFIWSSGRSRIWKLDCHLYYFASAHFCLLVMFHNMESKLWVCIAWSICPGALTSLPWTWSPSCHNTIPMSFSTHHTLVTSCSIRPNDTLVDIAGPLLPVHDNQEFLSRFSSNSFFGEYQGTPHTLL